MLLWRIGFSGRIKFWADDEFPPDFGEQHRKIIKRVAPYTLTTPERLHALIEAVRYLIANRTSGAFVECGVYRGGSMMAMALTLLEEGITDRELFLFDTFEGMPKPGVEDVDYHGVPAADYFKSKRTSDTSSNWTRLSEGEVREVMHLSGYDQRRMHFVKGMVEDTLPTGAPDSIALLRLDTDFYSSTKHELVHLYHRVSPGGIIIIDDYGHFRGAKQAVDEFFAEMHPAPLLQRIDYSGRLLIKPATATA